MDGGWFSEQEQQPRMETESIFICESKHFWLKKKKKVYVGFKSNPFSFCFSIIMCYMIYTENCFWDEQER